MEPYLIQRKNLTVVTNNIVLAANLSAHNVKVVCLGGTVVESPSMLYGPETVENASRYRVDKMFFATDGMTSTGLIASGLYDLLFKVLARNAGEIFYLVDHRKINKPFTQVYCDLSQVHHVISDYAFPPELLTAYPHTHFVTVEKTARE